MTATSSALRRKGQHITDEQIHDFVARRLRGETLQSIADLYQTTPQYVYALTRMGASPEDYAAAMGRSATMPAETVASIAADVNAWLIEKGTANVQEVLDQFELTLHQWQLIRPRIDQSRVISRTTRTPKRPQYTDDMIKDALRRIFDVAGGEKSVLTAQAYEANRDKENDPSVPTIHNRFGSWAAACAAAGVPSGTRVNGTADVRSTWTNADLLGWLARWRNTLGENERPSYARYDAWQRDNEGAPSGSMVRVRLKQYGNWAEIVRASLTQETVEQ